MITYHIQPMTGTVHRDPKCSLGTARYGTSPCCDNADMSTRVQAGTVKVCSRCVTPAVQR